MPLKNRKPMQILYLLLTVIALVAVLSLLSGVRF